MGLKNYLVGGAVVLVLLSSIDYFTSKVGEVRREELVKEFNINCNLFQVMRENRKFSGDNHRIDILGEQGLRQANIYIDKENGDKLCIEYIWGDSLIKICNGEIEKKRIEF